MVFALSILSQHKTGVQPIIEEKLEEEQDNAGSWEETALAQKQANECSLLCDLQT